MNVEEPEETTLVREITKIVRTADEQFEKDGGSSRHWVRDNFLPTLRSAGWRIVKMIDENEASLRGEVLRPVGGEKT